MPQLFTPAVNSWFRVACVAFPVGSVAFCLAAYRFLFTPYATQVGFPQDQPVPFSHKHHVSGLGIDCRYCHTSVERSAFAGMPSTHTCMTCHSQIWTEAPVLEPVRHSQATGEPIGWTRVHNLPDFVYFNHSIHIAKGIACADCHGRIEEMPIVWKEKTLQMGWCLDCHRHPETGLRPPAQEFNLNWTPNPSQDAVGRRLVRTEHILPERELTDCSACHR